MNSTLPISPDQTVNQVIQAFPATVAVFANHQIDACCGGALPLQVVCEKHRIDLALLLAELNQAAR
jgi:iron-sulfur cluster repair protein YtfE (RIC family)